MRRYMRKRYYFPTIILGILILYILVTYRMYVFHFNNIQRILHEA